MDREREEQRELVRQMAAHIGLDLTGLARAASISPTTLTRFVNSPVKHLLTTRTMAKLAQASGYQPKTGAVLTFRPAANAEVLAGIGLRMRAVRAVMARSSSDSEVAEALGWDGDRMLAAFAGSAEPSIFEIATFARRMQVTTDFLLLGRLDGLSRRAERLILDTYPQFLEDTGERTGTVRGARKKGPRR